MKVSLLELKDGNHKVEIETLLKDYNSNWVSSMRRLTTRKLATLPQSPEIDLNVNLNNSDFVDQSNDYSLSFRKNKSFKAFNFDKSQKDYVHKINGHETSNTMRGLVHAFKMRVDDLDRNIDEDFLLNITEKVIPEHEVKMKEFFNFSDKYSKNVNNKTLQKAYYLENYVYKRRY